MTSMLLKICIFKIVKKKKRLEGSSYFSCSELPNWKEPKPYTLSPSLPS